MSPGDVDPLLREPDKPDDHGRRRPNGGLQGNHGIVARREHEE